MCKKALWEWKGWRKGKRGLQADSEGNTGQFPNPELPRKLTCSCQMTFVQNAYHVWIVPQQTQALLLQEGGPAMMSDRRTCHSFLAGFLSGKMGIHI